MQGARRISGQFLSLASAARPSAGAATGTTACALTLGVGAANGGYFPPAWGWIALLLLWAVLLGLVLRRDAGLGRPDTVVVAALGMLVAWTWLSTAWSLDLPQSVLEGQRTLVYAAAAAALLLLVSRERVASLLAGVCGGIAVVDLYALSTRLFPDRFAQSSFSPNRLAEPLGYWNGLGVFAVIGLVLALGFAARARNVAAGAAAAALLPIAAATLYFTFSRGAWGALVLGLAAALAVDPRRLQLLTVALVLAPAPALAVVFGVHRPSLTHVDASLGAAAHDGHRLAAIVLALCMVNSAFGAALAAASARVRPSARLRRAYVAGLAALAATTLAVGIARWGDPVSAARDAYHSFVTRPAASSNLNRRLFTLYGSGRDTQWHAAWTEYRAHPLLGGGAGSYEQWWLQHRPDEGRVRDAHSLYLEQLAELGPVGLLLLLVAFAVPLLAAVRARAHPLVPAALGAYAAFLTHAAVDWDWELPAVTLAALACGLACLVFARDGEPVPFRAPARIAVGALTAMLAAAALVGLVGNTAVHRGEQALRRGDYLTAEDDARRAARWAPWSSAAWRLLGTIQGASFRPAAAAHSFRNGLDLAPDDWLLWYGLAGVTHGAEQRRAAAEVLRLNPRSAEAAEMRALLRRRA